MIDVSLPRLATNRIYHNLLYHTRLSRSTSIQRAVTALFYSPGHCFEIATRLAPRQSSRFSPPSAVEYIRGTMEREESIITGGWHLYHADVFRATGDDPLPN